MNKALRVKVVKETLYVKQNKHPSLLRLECELNVVCESDDGICGAAVIMGTKLCKRNEGMSKVVMENSRGDDFLQPEDKRVSTIMSIFWPSV